jgi:integrase/recombinase XerD
MDGRPGTIAFEVERYLEDLKLKTTSKHTLRGYRYNLAVWQRWCEAHGVTECALVERDLVSTFICQAQLDGLQPRSVAHRATILRTWFAHVVERGFLAKAPPIRSPPSDRKLPRCLSVSEVERILHACEDGTPVGMRDRAVLETLWSTGARNSEVCALNLGDVDIEQRSVHFRKCKNSKERMGRLTERAATMLTRYVQHGRLSKDDEALFISRIGARITDATLRAIVKARANAAGVSGAHPHAFRHAFATAMLARGAEVFRLSKLLGHANVETTALYLHVDQHALDAELMRHHPNGTPEVEEDKGTVTLTAEQYKLLLDRAEANRADSNRSKFRALGGKQ